MDDKQLVDFINDMMRTDLDCVDCTEVNDVVARYVDLEVTGTPLEEASPEMAAHLTTCPPCADMHATLLEVARLEASGGLTGTEELWADVAELVDRRESRRFRDRVKLRGPIGTWGVALAATAAMLFLFLDARSARQRADQAEQGLADARESIEAMDVRIDEMLEGLENASKSAKEAQEIAEKNTEALVMINQYEQYSMIKQNDGSWTRIYFSPDTASALVAVGSLPELGEGQYLECWLKRAADGTMLSAGKMPSQDPEDMEHWKINAATAISNYSMFVITIEPGNQMLFEVPLTKDS